MKEAPEQLYTKGLQQTNAEMERLVHRRRQYGFLRFALALLAIFLGWWLWPMLWVVLPLVALFLWVVRRDADNRDTLAFQEKLKWVQEQELLYFKHQFHQHADGQLFVDAAHPYASDLDLFGKHSLFQFINRAQSGQGQASLASALMHPLPLQHIAEQQDAVRELSGKHSFRQKVQARGMASAIDPAMQQAVKSWTVSPPLFSRSAFWIAVRFLQPLLAFTWLGLYLRDLVTDNQFLTGLIVLGMIAFHISRKILPIHQSLGSVTEQLEALALSLQEIQQEEFRNPMLQKMRGQVFQQGTAASQQIHELKKILDCFDLRMNPLVHVPLNIFLGWDIWQAFALERWKENHTADTDHWFNTLAEFEMLNSFSTLSFNHPAWSFPELVGEEPLFEGIGLNHPLIPPTTSVANDFSLRGKGRVAVITGSNMAGKSTFLRTVGVNMVLACAGAPVCARKLRIYPMQIMSSMRIMDNLEENTSTFYAELKKLGAIIEAVRQQKPVFILLDEILRGTNSQDRQTGSMALVRQLIREQAIGIVATHDLGLAAMEKEYPDSVSNHHFDVQVSDGEMYFDYTLKSGVCTSMNASLLMRKIGISLDQ